MAVIDPRALVDTGAELAEDVVVGPFAVVEAGTSLGPGCKVAAHAIVRRGSRLGAGVRVDSFAVVGGDPQDFKFDPATPSGVEIGDGCWLREHVTVHRSTRAGGTTRLGKRVFLMASAHVAHDCVLHDDVVLANAVLLAGHVEIGARSFLGGSSVYHQFLRVGEGVMVSGNASMSYDIPPWVMAAERNEAHGLNVVGLRRAGFGPPAFADLKACYRAVFFAPGAKPPLAAAARAAGLGAHPPGAAFLDFVANPGRRKGFIRSTSEGLRAGAAGDGEGGS